MTGCEVDGLAMRSNLARQVSAAVHDLAQPMTSLHLLLETMRSSSLPDGSRDLLELALEEINRCRGELGYLRELVRIYTQQERRTETCVIQILRESVESLNDAFLDKGVDVLLGKDLPMLSVSMPELQIRTLFFSILHLANMGVEAGNCVHIHAPEARQITISCDSLLSLNQDNRESKRAMDLIHAIATTNGIITQFKTSPFTVSLTF
jgi:signal transduction histidine kinase